jgi:REP element-mobilizing transposase RayT
VWTTKYRYQVLEGELGQRCREFLREIAQSLELVIYAGSINRDHVHMLIGIPPHVSVPRAVQYEGERFSQAVNTTVVDSGNLNLLWVRFSCVRDGEAIIGLEA